MIIGVMASNTLPRGSITFTVSGGTVYNWTVPVGVTSISAVLVGGGGAGWVSNGWSTTGGGGGGLRYINSLPVTPGEILTVYVGTGGIQTSSSALQAATFSAITRGSDTLVVANPGQNGSRTTSSGTTLIGPAGGGGTAFGAGPFGGIVGGGNGGRAGDVSQLRTSGGGGAGGYSGNGGNGATRTSTQIAATDGSGGGGGGGGQGGSSAGSGGGVGVRGQGTSGAAGASASGSTGVTGGGGGSGGTDGVGSETLFRVGGTYGGGGGANGTSSWSSTVACPGGNGVVRILWGPDISFPSTNVN